MDRIVKYSCEGLPAEPLNFSLSNKRKMLPPKDGSNTYYWHLANFTPDMDKYKVILNFQKAMGLWQQAFDMIKPVGNYLHLESTDDPTKADFVFTFGPQDHEFMTNEGKWMKCQFPFDGHGGVLAHAWAYNSTPGYAGTMHLDEAEDWSKKNLVEVIAHEFGHILVIGHSKVPGALMGPFYSGNNARIHNDDLKATQVTMGPIKEKFAPVEVVQKKKPCRFLRVLLPWRWGKE